MNQEQVDRAIGMVAQAAERLGYEGARIWPQMVGITFVQSLCGLILGPLVLLAAIIGYRRLWARREAEKALLSERGHYSALDEDMAAGMLMIFGGIGVVLLGAFVVLTIPGLVSSVIYPEAATVLKLVGK